jgi:hypothetical protein
MTNHVVRKGSIYRTEVVLKTKTNVYYLECGVGYQTSKTTMPYQTPPPFHSGRNFNPKNTEIVSINTDTNSSDMDTVLFIQTFICLFKY